MVRAPAAAARRAVGVASRSRPFPATGALRTRCALTRASARCYT